MDDADESVDAAKPPAKVRKKGGPEKGAEGAAKRPVTVVSLAPEKRSHKKKPPAPPGAAVGAPNGRVKPLNPWEEVEEDSIDMEFPAKVEEFLDKAVLGAEVDVQLLNTEGRMAGRASGRVLDQEPSQLGAGLLAVKVLDATDPVVRAWGLRRNQVLLHLCGQPGCDYVEFTKEGVACVHCLSGSVVTGVVAAGELPPTLGPAKRTPTAAPLEGARGA